MPDSDLFERIRTIFLQERSFVSIAAAAVLLGWPRGEMKAAIAAGEIELTTACSGPVVGREELIAKAIELWPAEWIERALRSRAAAVLPEVVRTRMIAARVPRYQAAMLDVLAERQQTTVGHLLTRALDDLGGEHFDVLAPAIAGFADAVAWPHLHETRQPC